MSDDNLPEGQEGTRESALLSVSEYQNETRQEQLLSFTGPLANQFG